MTDIPRTVYTVTVHDQFGTLMGEPMGPVAVQVADSGALILKKPDGTLDAIFNVWGYLNIVKAESVVQQGGLTR